MNIIVVSPHPDDETLGAGGLLFRLKNEGHKIYWLNMTNINNSQDYDVHFKDIRKKQISDVISKYQFDGFYDLCFLPSSLENEGKTNIISKISNCFEEVKPNWVILPNPDDAHTDHRITYEAAMSCTKVFRYPYIKRIMTMEILSETDFNKAGISFSPNYFVNITETFNQKIEAMKIYSTELGEHPFPRSLDSLNALATLRGATCGSKYAEAYKIIKWIE